jgi:hypothetical protein
MLSPGMGDTAAKDVPTQKGRDGGKKRRPAQGADTEPQAAAEEKAGKRVIRKPKQQQGNKGGDLVMSGSFLPPASACVCGSKLAWLIAAL